MSIILLDNIGLHPEGRENASYEELEESGQLLESVLLNCSAGRRKSMAGLQKAV